MKLVLVCFVVVSVVGIGAVSGPQQDPKRPRVDVVGLKKEKVAVLRKLEKMYQEHLKLIKVRYDDGSVGAATVTLFRTATLDARVRRLDAELELPGVGRDQRIALLRKKLAVLQETEKVRERVVRLAKVLSEENYASSDDLAKARATAVDASVRRIDCEIELALLGVAAPKKAGKK